MRLRDPLSCDRCYNPAGAIRLMPSVLCVQFGGAVRGPSAALVGDGAQQWHAGRIDRQAAPHTTRTRQHEHDKGRDARAAATSGGGQQLFDQLRGGAAAGLPSGCLRPAELSGGGGRTADLRSAPAVVREK
jgi:hypothetical protein